MTRLEAFIEREGIQPKELATIARVSRQHLLRIRQGQMDPTRHVVVRLTMACAILLQRLVDPDELFNLAEIGRDKGSRLKRAGRRT